MMIRTAFAATLFFALTNALKADKFYLDTPEDTAATQGNAKGRMIEGVLLSETSKTYTVRVAGGQIEIAKSLVKRHVKGALTLEQIETRETERAAATSQAETRRREVQAVEASARRATPPTSKPDAGQDLLIKVDFRNLLPGYTFRAYDPVLRRANLSGLRQVIEDYLRREVKSAAHR